MFVLILFLCWFYLLEAFDLMAFIFTISRLYIEPFIQSFNRSFILTRFIYSGTKNLFKIRTCVNKIYSNYIQYIITFHFKTTHYIYEN